MDTQTALGIRLKAMRLDIKGYETRFLGSNDLLFSSHHDFFHFQTCCNNALPFGYRSEGEKPALSFTSIIRLFPTPWYSLNLRLSFAELTGVATEIGNGFKVSEIVWIGAGFNTQTRELASHLLAFCGKGSLSYAVAVHPALGITHRVGFILRIPKDRKDSDEQ
jgi:hypothetical protein